MTKINFTSNRLILLTWIIFPIILVWLAIGYLLGLSQTPIWAMAENQVPVTVSAPPPVKPFQWQNTGVITLWFDDGWRSQYYVGLPVLEQKGFVGAMAPITDVTGTLDYINWAQLKRMQRLGWEITSHTRSHNCHLIDRDVASMVNELRGSRLILQSHGLLADNFVTPCGADSPEMIEVVKREYLSLRTSGAGLNPIPVTNQYTLLAEVLNNTTTLDDVKRFIQNAKETNQWLILSFHQIDYSNDRYALTPEFYSQIIDEVAASGLPVALPSQVLEISQKP